MHLSYHTNKNNETDRWYIYVYATVTTEAYMEILDNAMTVDIHQARLCNFSHNLYTELIGWQTSSETISFHTDLTSRDQRGPPDNSPRDFIWEYVKEKVVKAMTDIINALKHVIREVISSIDLDVLEAVISNFKNLANRCIEQQGVYFEHLFETKYNIGIYTLMWPVFHRFMLIIFWVISV